MMEPLPPVDWHWLGRDLTAALALVSFVLRSEYAQKVLAELLGMLKDYRRRLDEDRQCPQDDER